MFITTVHGTNSFPQITKIDQTILTCSTTIYSPKPHQITIDSSFSQFLYHTLYPLPVHIIDIILSFDTIVTNEDITIHKQINIENIQQRVTDEIIHDHLVEQEIIFHSTLELQPTAEARYKFHPNCLCNRQHTYHRCCCFLTDYFPPPDIEQPYYDDYFDDITKIGHSITIYHGKLSTFNPPSYPPYQYPISTYPQPIQAISTNMNHNHI